MHDLNLIYQELRWWLPMLTIGTIIWKAKKALTTYADALLTNHLAHIQTSMEKMTTDIGWMKIVGGAFGSIMLTILGYLVIQTVANGEQLSSLTASVGAITK